MSRGAVKNNSAPRPDLAQLLPPAAAAMSRKKRCSTSLFHAKRRPAARGVTARGREKAVHLLSKPQRWSNCHTARGREKAVKLLEEDEIKLDGLTARGREKAG